MTVYVYLSTVSFIRSYTLCTLRRDATVLKLLIILVLYAPSSTNHLAHMESKLREAFFSEALSTDTCIHTGTTDNTGKQT